MSLQFPDLGRRSYGDILDEMVSSIPKYSENWTNYNPSDPGIMILEILAWIFDATLYRIDRLSEESYINFLRLVAGASGEEVETLIETLKKNPYADKYHIDVLEILQKMEKKKKRERKDIIDMKAAALLFIQSNYRAITEENFKTLAIEATLDRKEGSPQVKRAIVRGNPEGNVEIIIVSDQYEYLFSWNDIPGDDNERLIGILKERFDIEWAVNAKIEKIDDVKTIRLSSENHYVSLKLTDDESKVILETDDDRTDQFIAKMEKDKLNIYQFDKYIELKETVKKYLEPRKLICTKIIVKEPVFTPLNIYVEVVCVPDFRSDPTSHVIRKNINEFLDQLEGGDNKKGWDYGRALTIFELYHIIEETEGVDRVVSVVMDGNPSLKIKQIEGLIHPINIKVNVVENK